MWLETTHAIIHLYRAKVAETDKAIAEAPQAHRKSNHHRRGGDGGANAAGGSGSGGNQGAMLPPVGPTARRKLIHSFRQFLSQEEDKYRILLGRLAADLSPTDLARLRPLGIEVDLDDQQLEAKARRTEEEKRRDRARAVPLAHKALICFGDLARYRELYNENKPTGAGGAPGDGKRGGKRGNKLDTSATDKKQKNWTKAAECYHQARLLLPDNGESRAAFDLGDIGDH